MPRYYPGNDCDLYTERTVDNYFKSNPKYILRKIQSRNCVRWFRDPTNKNLNRSIIQSWGEGQLFKNSTGLMCDEFIKSRLRKRSKLPIAGRRGLWKISRAGVAGMCNKPLHTWNFQEWLQNSNFKMDVTKNSD